MTRWSLVALAGEVDEQKRDDALSALLKTYLPVLDWYLTRHSGLDVHKREDFIQSFVAHKILGQNLFAKATPDRGRFRSFLLGSFQNFIRDELRKEQAARRAPPGGALLPLEDVENLANDLGKSGEELHQGWVKQVVAEAVERMEAECGDHQRDDVWQIFRLRLLNPILDGDPPVPYDELMDRLGLLSPSQASNLLVTAKRMFARHLEAVVVETVDHPEQAQEELKELRLGLG